MADLLESIRGWRSLGAAIQVLCYDASAGSYETGVQRDAIMAESIVEARHADPTATLVVLSGNIHNRTKPAHPGTRPTCRWGCLCGRHFPMPSRSIFAALYVGATTASEPAVPST